MRRRIWISIAFATVALYAKTLDLHDIEQRIEHDGMLQKALRYETLARDAQSRAETSDDPLSLSVEGLRAYPDRDKGGNEFAVGLSKPMKLPGVRSQEMRIARLETEAVMSERKVSVIAFVNDVRRYYHNYCLESLAYDTFSEHVRDVGRVIEKKRKAYELEEISRMDLVRLEMEYRRLESRQKALGIRVKSAKEALAALIGVDGRTRFACRDLYPIKENIGDGKAFEATKRAYEKRALSEKERIERFGRAIDRIEVYADYTNEIDTERYGVGVTLPLSFTSDRYEAERAAALYRNSALEYAHKQTLRQKEARARQMRLELKAQYQMVVSTRADLRDFDKHLFAMLKRSFELGEISATEYILGEQQRFELLQRLFDAKKRYYRTLFEWMTTIERKDIK